MIFAGTLSFGVGIWHKMDVDLIDSECDLDLSDVNVEVMKYQPGEIHLMKYYQPILCTGYLRFHGFKWYPNHIGFLIGKMVGDPLGTLIQFDEECFESKDYWEGEVFDGGHCMGKCIKAKFPEELWCGDCWIQNWREQAFSFELEKNPYCFCGQVICICDCI